MRVFPKDKQQDACTQEQVGHLERNSKIVTLLDVRFTRQWEVVWCVTYIVVSAGRKSPATGATLRPHGLLTCGAGKPWVSKLVLTFIIPLASDSRRTVMARNLLGFYVVV